MVKEFSSLHAEEAVVGSIIIDKEAQQFVMSTLEVHDFTDENLAIIFKVVKDLYEKHKLIDMVTVVNALKSENKLESIGGFNFVQNLADSVNTTSNIETYINIILDKSKLNKLLGFSSRLKTMIKDSSEDVVELLSEVEKEIFEITRNHKTNDFVSSETFVQETIDKIQSLIDKDEEYTGLTTGYKTLDKITSGFQNGDYVVLAARPSMGKTALALNLMLRLSEQNQKQVALFSLEMPSQQIANRMLSIRSMVELGKIKAPKYLKVGDKDKLYLTADELKGSNLWINDQANLTVNQITTFARKLYSDQKGELGAIIIDYLGLIRTATRGLSRVIEVSRISAALKALARELNIPVIVLSQLSREVEKRESKRPILSDLRDSGAIEQDADLVMFLFSEEYYRNKDEGVSNATSRFTELIIAKHRNGSIGSVKFNFIPDKGIFQSVDG